MPGLTPAQIRRAVTGSPPPAAGKAARPATPSRRPHKAVRAAQTTDNRHLLNLPYGTSRFTTRVPVPEGFEMRERAEVSVVVPLYRQPVENLLGSWDAGNDGVRVELVFVDDYCPERSKDRVLEWWVAHRDAFPGPVGRLYANAVRQGWPTCCNIGAAYATGDTVVFLHPATMVSKGWLRTLLRVLRRPEVRAAAPVQLDVDGRTFVDAGLEWSWDRNEFLTVGVDGYRGRTLANRFFVDNVPADLLEFGSRDAVSSTCLAVGRQEFNRAGGFHPGLRSRLWADADFCLRLREAGGSVACQGNCQIFRRPCADEGVEEGRAFFANRWLVSGRADKFFRGRPTPRKEPESVVVRRTAAHGDVLLAAAVLPALRALHPKAKIIFYTDCPEVLQGNPHVDKVVASLSERWFDLYYDLDMAYEYRPDANILTAYAEAVGVEPERCELFLHCEPYDGLPEKYAVVHAGKTLWAGRNWSTLKFDQLSQKLRSRGLPVVCVGTASDHRPSGCDHDLRGRTTVPQLASVVRGARCFAGIDSLPMHVAQTFRVPGVAFFGALRPSTRLVRGGRIVAATAEGLACLGCHHRKAPPCVSTTVCEAGVQECVNQVSVGKVWRLLEPLL